MEKEPGKTTGILKYDNMESDAKAKKVSNDVGTHAGYGMTRVTPNVTPAKNLFPHFDANNYTSRDDDDTNSSTSNSSYHEMKVWVKKAGKKSGKSVQNKPENTKCSDRCQLKCRIIHHYYSGNK